MDNNLTENVSIFDSSNELQQMELENLHKYVKHGRNTLFILGILLPLSELFVLYSEFNTLDFGWQLWSYIVALALVYIGLGILTYKKASLAVLLGLIVYISLMSFGLYLSYTAMGSEGAGATFFKGILIKAIFIYLLTMRYKKAKQYEAMKQFVAYNAGG